MPTLTQRGDPKGVLQQEVTWPSTYVGGGDEALVYKASYVMHFPPGRIISVATFLGLDTGDIVECHAEVIRIEDNLRIYQRSLHKEAPTCYDAWDEKEITSTDWEASKPQRLMVNVLCRVTGTNKIVYTPRGNPLSAYFQPCVVVTYVAYEE